MQFNQSVLEKKGEHLDHILGKEALLTKVLDQFAKGLEYRYEVLERPWNPGGGSTLFNLVVGEKDYFLKVKHTDVRVESRLETEASFIDVPALKNEYDFFEKIKDFSSNVPQFFEYVEADGFGFLFVEHLSPFNRVTINLNAEELLDVYREIEKTVYQLYQHDIVHTDIHENNIMFRGKTPVLIDYEEARVLSQVNTFEESLDVVGENAYGNVGQMPEGHGFIGGYTCLGRMRLVFTRLINAKLDDLVSRCNFDSACPFLTVLDHGTDQRIYQSISLPGVSIAGQRPVFDHRIEHILQVADKLFQEPFTHLDIGSNVGRFNLELSRSEKVKKSIGVEAYHSYVDLARVLAFISDATKVEFINAECGENQLSQLLHGEKIDLVTIYSVYHHIRNKKAFIEDLARIDPAYLLLEMPVQTECYEGKTWEEEISSIAHQMNMPFWYPLTQSADYQRPIVLISKNDVSAQLFQPEKTEVQSLIDETHERPRVSIILPTYNDLAFLPKAVDSILAQTYTDFEMIVVDDGSTDGTRGYLESLSDPRIHIIHQQNQRLPRALNTGFTAARGDLLTWISSDNYCAPIFLEALVKALDTFPNAGFAYSAFAWINANDQITGMCRDQDMDYRTLLLDKPPMASFMYRRVCQDRVGLYDPELEGAEDWDMWLRIAEQFETAYVSEILYYYREHGDSMTTTMREKILHASQTTVVKAFKRKFDQLDLEHLYPAIQLCNSPNTATTHALFDLVGMVLRAPLCPVETASRWVEQALAVVSDSAEILSNSMLFYSRTGQWERVQNLLETLRRVNHPTIQNVCRQVSEARRQRNPGILDAAPVFDLDRNDSELFQIEQKQKQIFSLTNADSADSQPDFKSTQSQLKAPQTDPATLEGSLTGAAHDNRPMVSVIVPTYNRPKMFEDAIKSVLAQTYRNFEIIVINDCGQDVDDIIRGLNRDNNISYLRHGKNSGLSAARNTGLRQAGGEIITYLDDDDFFYADHLETVVSALQKGDANFVYTEAQYIEEQCDNDGRKEISRSRPFQGIDYSKERLHVGNYIPVNTWAHRKEIVNIIGNFDESLTALEDWDFLLRVSRNCQVKQIRKVTVEVRTRATKNDNMSDTARKNFPALYREIYRRYSDSENSELQKERKERLEQLDNSLAANLVDIRTGSQGRAENIESNMHQPPVIRPNVTAIAVRPMRITVFSLDYKTYACAKLRLLGPLHRLADSVEYRWAVAQQSKTGYDLDKGAVDWADLFIVQRVFPGPDTESVLDDLFASGKPVIYEADDLLTEPLPADNPVAQPFSTRIQHIRTVISKATLVSVSTEALKAEVEPYNHNVRVLPNLLDDRVWQPKAPKQLGDEIVIGYAGTATHGGDLALVEAALEKIASRYTGCVRFIFMGFATDRIRALPGFQEAPFCEYQDYSNVLSQLPIDIAIAPLTDSRFNRGKSHVKWLEYSMCGFAGVYSDLPPYNGAVRNDETGLLAGPDSDDWFDALVYLIENPEARQRIALAAQREVAERHTLASGSRDYLAAWESARTSETYGTVTDLNAAPRKIDLDNPKALCPEYQKWLDKRALTEVDAQLMAERMFGKWTIEPVLHLVMVIAPGQEALLANTLDSLDRQLYKVWGLSVISTLPCPDPLFEKVANLEWIQVAENPWQAADRVVSDTAADWVMFIEPGDLVWPQGLFGFADAINRNPDWKFIYSDEDMVNTQYEHTAHCFKPDCNPLLLRSSSYIGNACLVRREALDQAGGFTNLAGVQRHDAALKIMDQFGEFAIGHIADILYSRLSSAIPVLEPSVIDANTRDLLTQHLERISVAGAVQGGFLPGAFRVDYRHAENPKVSILLAAKDRIGLTEDCVETLIEHTDYPSYEILIADYGSEAEDTYDFHAELAGRFPDTVRVIDQCKADNPLQAINQAANEATGDYLLMLSPNVTFVQSNWLARLMQHAQRPGVGAAGPRIAGIDKTIRHAGYVLGLNGVASSAFQGLDLAEDGYLQRAKLERNCMAISGACLLVDKELFKSAGGLDEANLKANFWDVDLCLKLGEMNQKVIWTPHASVVQQAQPDYLVAQSEDQAREFRTSDEAWMTDRWREKIAHDPGYNKNLDLIDGGFTLEVDVAAGWDRAHHDRPRIMAFPLNSEGCGEYRVRGPMRGLKETCRIELALLPNHASGGRLRTPSTAELLRAAPDVLLLQHTVSDCHIEAVRAYKEFTDTFLVYGTDDLMHKLPQKNSRRKQIFRDMKHRIRQVLGCCDRMIVSTQPLADAYGNMIDDIRVVPNYLEGAAWGQGQSLRRQGQKSRVGWAGACQHHGDLELIADVVKATAHEVEWVFMGMLIDELKPYVKEFHEGVIFQQYPQKLASLNLDLAIAPLDINPFNEAKGNLRLLEYGMMGWPVVCSEIYPYHNAPVTRVKNNASDWVNAIRERIHDLDTAEKEGDFLKAWVEKNWMLEDHLDEWLDALTQGSQISAAEPVCNIHERRASASR